MSETRVESRVHSSKHTRQKSSKLKVSIFFYNVNVHKWGIYRSRLSKKLILQEIYIELPKKRGSHSLYVICCRIPITSFLVSWYRTSSFHWGFKMAKSSAKLLWSRKNMVSRTAISEIPLTRISPELDNKVNREVKR